MSWFVKDFKWSFFFTLVAVFLAYQWAGLIGSFTVLILIALEISISFDNAVVNAKILNGMDKIWQDRFLTWGVFIAVFGMRVIFPILIVALSASLPFTQVVDMALNDQKLYEQHVMASSYVISAFGGIFLLMVFLEFLFDYERELLWISFIEKQFSKLGKIESLSIAIGLFVLTLVTYQVPEKEKLSVMISGVSAMFLFIILSSLSSYMKKLKEDIDLGKTSKKSIVSAGFMTFAYLEVLDASFSLDGVIGAFAVTKDIIVIMLGLGAGALFVRSITISLVRRGVLNNYVYLEHSAHYAIGALAMIMFLHMFMDITEVVTGGIGIAFILAGIYSSSIRRNQKKEVKKCC
jgi:hypothetical protein